MKAIDPAFAAHLEASETTLCTCWRITRRDGVVLGFTDHDCTLHLDGTDFLPIHGLEGGEVPARLGAQVETGEVTGILAHDAISRDDVLLGRYDGATVETWRVNWAAPDQHLLLRRDTVGEIVDEDGVFRAELRSAHEALNRTGGRLYGALCDAVLGDARCGVDRDAPAFRGTGTVLAIEDGFRLRVAGIESFADGWFGFGTVHWTSGKRAGLEDGVKAHRGEVLTLAARIGDWVEVGDAFSVHAGCDRRWDTCRNRFANAANFRGFPHIPGNDYVLRYPRAGVPTDGRVVRK